MSRPGQAISSLRPAPRRRCLRTEQESHVSPKNTRIVYSSEGGRRCPECGRPQDEFACGKAGPPVVAGPVRVSLETKGRNGKAVTVITGLPLGGPELAALGRQLKQKCGAGGSVKDGVIEIQGDHRATATGFLQGMGYRPKG